ncbi:MAG TPA: dTMP kinase, partial [Caldimonas sp.]|nr:dTMP kinase [Caldimonas sp.]
ERMLRDLERWVHDGLQPDLTLWFDVDPAVAAARRAKARVSDRFESEDAAFFERVRAGYAARMGEAAGRFCRIDSTLEKAAVERQIDDAVAALEERRR